MPELDLHLDADDPKLLAQVVDYYHRTLKETTEGLDYLRRRGLTVSDAIDRFRIGYANRTLGLKLPSKQFKAGKQIRTRLQQLGLYRGTGREHFNGCVTFPITACDGSGRIVDIYGRKTNAHRLRKGTPLDMHLSDQRRGVWNIDAFQSDNAIILCPSLFDALTFWSAGYRNVTCTFGPEALTDDHLAAFHEFGIRRVLLMVKAIAPMLQAAGMDCGLLKFPPGMDANQYALRVANPSQALGAVIREAEWLGDGQPMATASAVIVPPPSAKPGEPNARHVGTEDSEVGSDDELDQRDDVKLLGDEFDDLDDDHEPGDKWDDPDDGEERQHDGRKPDAPSGDDLHLDDAHNPASTQPDPKLVPSLLPPLQDIDSDVHGEEVIIRCGNRRYRVRGLSKNISFDQLKVNVLAASESGMFVDTIDLYVARHRRQFTAQAAVELSVDEQAIKKDLGRVLLKLEELQGEQIARMTQTHQPPPEMTPEEKDVALEFLRAPNLLDRILNDFDVVGETTNKLVGYLAGVSRKLDQPLAVVLQSSSAAGKTSLMDAILTFVPPEDQVKYSAMTGQSLFYMGETDLKHKILAIVEDEGAERASYALKLLQSDGTLTIASTGKNSSTGRLVTQTYRVEGPVMIFLTTTAIRIDEELLNRCLVLSVDENREQTRAIHHFQRRRQTLPGLLAEQNRRETLTVHHNAQRLLRPLLVANPYAESLTFLDDKTRTRRDHLKYLTLMRAIALLHQYQRPIRTVVDHGQKVEYIEVTLEDIAVANRLASEVLTLIDEMEYAACQRLGIDRGDYRFSRRDIREFTGWGHTQLKVHLKRLEELEYLLVHRGGRGQSFVYELLFDPPPETGTKFLARLADVDQLRRIYDATGRGSNGPKSGGGRGHVRLKSDECRSPEIDASPGRATAALISDPEVGRNAHRDVEQFATS
jgi:hypothetical protein